MSLTFKQAILGLRLPLYGPIFLLCAYWLSNTAPQQVQANPAANPLPSLMPSDPSTWPTPDPSPLPVLPQRVSPPPHPAKAGQSSPESALPESRSEPAAVAPSPPVPPAAEGRIKDTIPVPIPSGSAPESVPKAISPPEGTVPPLVNPYAPDDYRLSIGDSISIFIANIPEFTTEHVLMSDGTVNLPVAGPMALWGMTLKEAGVAVKQRYVETDILRDPDVTVQLLASSPLKVAIAGQINRPGAYDIPVLDKKLPTLTDALKMAGGIASEADLRSVKVYRHHPTGGSQEIQVNLMALFQEADLSQNISLRNGDRIVLPQATIKPEEAKLLGSANISPDEMQVGILGEVLQPGLIKAPTHTSLNQALLLVGGFNSRAKKKTVELLRTHDDGSVLRQKIKVDWSQPVGVEANPILKHRDVVLVGRSAIARYSDFLDRIIGPINRTVPFLGILDLILPSSGSNR
ncbi:SLBB domain-containing protein [Lyngbya confervoides]|uniref:SLBB domain-containing protein n=1 Tax=Lyngbya confervoides BDU141951 TaxID=1574623 RepID=A0ABD4SZL6_9CYAN|nr:SLBB domain-containing protein [Lyngbya confervoides]MCM1981600.1 SLBB domain-containing protein [Lyngbya confervoides BDU141951]